jgi:hypothetical protein
MATQELFKWRHGDALMKRIDKISRSCFAAKGVKRMKAQMKVLWSFVDHKGNKQCVWLALDADTREVIGC